MALTVFARVVEQGGFTAAAGRLGLSPSAVTKTIARLEDELGIQLFTRTTRRLRTTDYGQEFYQRCIGILADLEDAEGRLRAGSAASRGRVRAVVPISFGRVTLVPELPRFFAQYPEITLELSFSDTAVDLIAEGYDVAVRTGAISEQRLTQRLLTRGPQVTFAAPSYLDRHGEPRAPEELRRHNCIVGRFGADWSFRGPDGDPFTLKFGGNAIINSGDALREAAVAGVGIGQGTWWLVRKDLERGALRPVLRDWMPEGNPVSVLYPPQRHLPAKLRAFIDFLVLITRTS